MSVHIISHSLHTLLLPKSIILASFLFCSFSRAILAFSWGFGQSHAKMPHFTTLVASNRLHISLTFSSVVPFSLLYLLFHRFILKTLFLAAFLVRAICCFVSKLSTIATSSLELFNMPFLAGRACKQHIAVFLFFPALNILHGLIFVFQNLLNFFQVI